MHRGQVQRYPKRSRGGLGGRHGEALAHGGHQPAKQWISFHSNAVSADTNVGQHPVTGLREEECDERDVAKP